MNFNFNQALADKSRRQEGALDVDRYNAVTSRIAAERGGSGGGGKPASDPNGIATAKTPTFSNIGASTARLGVLPSAFGQASPTTLPINEGQPGSGTRGRTLYSTDAAGKVTVPARSGYQTDGAGITPVQDDGLGTGGSGILSDEDAFKLRPANQISTASNPTPAQPKSAAQAFSSRGLSKEDKSNRNLAEQGFGNVVRKAGNVYTDSGKNPYLDQQFKEQDGLTGKQLMERRIATDESRRIEAAAKDEQAKLDALEAADPRVRVARIEQETTAATKAESAAEKKAAQDAAVNYAREQNPNLTKVQETAIRYGVKDAFKNDGDGGDLTTPQQRTNASIVAARRQLEGMTPADVLKRTQSTTNTGRENSLYDPNLAALVKLARSRKYGDDPAYDNFAKPANAAAQQPAQPAKAATQQPKSAPPGSPKARFDVDPAMKGYRFGEPSGQGWKVYDAEGRHIGYWE